MLIQEFLSKNVLKCRLNYLGFLELNPQVLQKVHSKYFMLLNISLCPSLSETYRETRFSTFEQVIQNFF